MPKKNCRRSLRNVYGAFYRFGLIDVPVKIYQDITGIIQIRVNEG